MGERAAGVPAGTGTGGAYSVSARCSRNTRWVSAPRTVRAMAPPATGKKGAAPRWRTPKPATATETGKVPMTASMTRLMTRPMSADGAQTWSIVTTTMFCQPLARA